MTSKSWSRGYVQAQDVADKRRGGNRVDIPSVRPPRGVAGIKCNPRALSFTNKIALTKILARYQLPAEGGATGAVALQAFVYSPSNRLRGSIQVAIEPDTYGSVVDPAFNVQPTWSIRAYARNPVTGRETPLQQAYPTSGTANLPDAYEFDSAAQLLRVDITVRDDSFSSSYIPNTQRANVMLICTWEPNTEVTPEELKEMEALCSITAREQVLIQNNAV